MERIIYRYFDVISKLYGKLDLGHVLRLAVTAIVAVGCYYMCLSVSHTFRHTSSIESESELVKAADVTFQQIMMSVTTIDKINWTKPNHEKKILLLFWFSTVVWVFSFEWQFRRLVAILMWKMCVSEHCTLTRFN